LCSWLTLTGKADEQQEGFRAKTNCHDDNGVVGLDAEVPLRSTDSDDEVMQTRLTETTVGVVQSFYNDTACSPCGARLHAHA